MHQIRQLIGFLSKGYSISKTVRLTGMARNTVREYKRRIEDQGLRFEDNVSMSDEALAAVAGDFCLDITYIWVHGENRWYYQLAIMDVYSRMILCWIFQKSVRQNDVIALMRHLDLRFGLKGVMIRNDNGGQFIAHSVRQTLEALEAHQEFTHVATPEENVYIESFHSIQERELLDRFEFASYYDARQHIEKYMHWYKTG